MARRAKNNPSTEIPSDWSSDLWQWAPKPTLAHWTSYPTYAYQQFYRANPRRVKARKNSEVDVPTSSSEAKAVPWKYAQNAGPFLPEMFPYGQGGRPYVYGNPAEEVSVLTCPTCDIELEDGEEDFCRFCEEQAEAILNPARPNRGHRGGLTARERGELPAWYFLKKKGRGWPAGDPRKDARDNYHAILVVRYMDRGFGNRSEYATLIRELARRYPVDSKANKVIWDEYRSAYDTISAKTWSKMPTIAELRRVS